MINFLEVLPLFWECIEKVFVYLKRVIVVEDESDRFSLSIAKKYFHYFKNIYRRGVYSKKG